MRSVRTTTKNRPKKSSKGAEEVAGTRVRGNRSLKAAPGREGPVVQLGENARRVLEKRYLIKDDSGRPVETPVEMFQRVARAVAAAEVRYAGHQASEEMEERFFRLMASLEMLPNSPTLMNAGRDLGQLSACFVLPVEDSMDSIFEALKNTALIHKSGGGTGFSFSRIRPRNDVVRTTRGISSGPISFMTVFDAATETIKQGGMRRGANMGILAADHPDILEFITCKQDGRKLNNFNISVAISESFMRAVENDEDYPLVNPRSGEEVGRLKAREVFDRIVESAWLNGEPGILFMDRINRDNPTPGAGRIESTNPCGEQPLLPYESCTLGSVNLAKFAGADGVDWERLAECVRLSVRFLDDVIDVNRYPLPEIEAATLANRKIGLGVMGLADLLIRLGIPYDSEQAVRLGEELMNFVRDCAVRASECLAAERGPFPACAQSLYSERPRRNATTTTIAPTGTISMIAGCSSGIEPLFALAFVRNVLENEQLVETHPLFEEIARREGFFSDALLQKILEKGSAEGMEEVPEGWRRIFVISHDIAPEWHIRMQAAFQKHTENSVSKTVNFRADASPDDVRMAFLLSYHLGCKGVTIYRDASRERQVLRKGTRPSSAGLAGSALDSFTLEPSSSGLQALSEESQPPKRLPTLAPRPRPQTMNGITRRTETSCGALYVTINWDETGRPFEVFTSMGKAGGCAASQAEAIGRLASLGLRSGVDAEQITRQLRGISCHLPRGLGKNRISSCADALAQGLHSFLHPEGGQLDSGPDNDHGESERLGVGSAEHLFRRGACPECQGPLEQEGGCEVCRDCGFSDCL